MLERHRLGNCSASISYAPRFESRWIALPFTSTQNLHWVSFVTPSPLRLHTICYGLIGSICRFGLRYFVSLNHQPATSTVDTEIVEYRIDIDMRTLILLRLMHCGNLFSLYICSQKSVAFPHTLDIRPMFGSSLLYFTF